MKSIKIEVMTRPVPQARPRFSRGKSFFGKVRAYDPERSRNYKEFISWHAKTKAKELGIVEPIKGAVTMELVFQMGEPNWYGNGKYHTKRPDIDNLTKAVKDALKGIIYADDSQIVEAHLYKQYGVPKVIITVTALEEELEEKNDTCVAMSNMRARYCEA
jgi:Holliday junction resolvase RusA-like endonuclease